MALLFFTQTSVSTSTPGRSSVHWRSVAGARCCRHLRLANMWRIWGQRFGWEVLTCIWWLVHVDSVNSCQFPMKAHISDALRMAVLLNWGYNWGFFIEGILPQKTHVVVRSHFVGGPLANLTITKCLDPKIGRDPPWLLSAVGRHRGLGLPKKMPKGVFPGCYRWCFFPTKSRCPTLRSIWGC